MALPTPPRSQQRGLIAPRRKRQYYEDFYGRRDYDEDFDRYADNCEDESDSDNESSALPYHNIAAKNSAHGPVGMIPRYPGFNYSTSDTILGTPLSYTNVTRAASIHDAEKTKKRQWQINPKVNNKTSIPVLQDKKFTPRKFGLFNTLKPAPEGINSRISEHIEGEDLDDRFRLLGESSDDFSLLGQESGDEEEGVPSPAMKAQSIREAPTGRINGDEEGDKEHLDASRLSSLQSISVDEPSQPVADVHMHSTVRKEAQPTKKEGRATAKTLSGISALIDGSHNTRASSRRNLRSASKGQGSTGDYVTARAATLHKKSKRKGVVMGAVGGREVGRRRSSRLGSHKAARTPGLGSRVTRGKVKSETEPRGLYVLISTEAIDMADVERHL